jgi:hypothetical protein
MKTAAVMMCIEIIVPKYREEFGEEKSPEL